jgi:multiple sugar transport system ATP-binding protein
MANVVLKHVDKTHPGDIRGVVDLNLEVSEGEFVVLVGPSGCGKTTTLRMIAGLEDVSGGEIYIGDRCVNRVGPADRDTAMVFQNYALYPHMSVYQNMAFGLKMRRRPAADIERRVNDAAKLLGIEPLLKRRPRELSGGERQRVALGRAIVREPRVFLFDEPLSNLDAQLRVQMRAEIARLHRRLKTTVIYVTHDQAEAMTLGSRIVVMDRGVIQQVDTPMNIYRRPINKFVASFVGSPGMNFFPGEFRSGTFQIGSGMDGALKFPIGDNIPDGVVTLGVRPEDFVAISESLTTANSFATVTVDIIEPMGHETMAHFALAGGQHVARLPGDATIRPGDRVSLEVRAGAGHLFSAADGARRN